jgi:hypothetical protein
MPKPKRWRPAVGDTLYILEWRPEDPDDWHSKRGPTFSPAKVTRVGREYVTVELRGYFQDYRISSINQHFTMPSERNYTGYIYTEKWASTEALARFQAASDRVNRHPTWPMNADQVEALDAFLVSLIPGYK